MKRAIDLCTDDYIAMAGKRYSVEDIYQDYMGLVVITVADHRMRSYTLAACSPNLMFVLD